MLIHENLIALATVFLDPQKGGSKGICYGLSCKYLDALFSKDRVSLYKRLALLEEYQSRPNELLDHIQTIYNKLKQNHQAELTPEEHVLLEIRPFFENIILQLHPNYYSEIYNRSAAQNYVLNGHLTLPQKLEFATPKLLHRSYHAKTKAELLQYVEKLTLLLQSTHQQAGFIIESDEHTISLSYNTISQKWELLNADNLVRSKSTNNYHHELNHNELVEMLQDAFIPPAEWDEQKEHESSSYTVFKMSCIGLEHEPTLTSQLDMLCPLLFDKKSVEKLNDDDVSIFFLAAQAGDLEALQAMLPFIQNINQPRYDGETALSMAVQEGHLTIVKYLISKGADITQTNDEGESLIHIAAAMGHLEMIEYLHALEINIDEKNALSGTPLMKAIMNNHFRTALLLIQKGADVNFVDEKNDLSLLQLAVLKGNLAILDALIKAGADIHYKNAENVSALKLAEQLLNSEAIALLKNSPAAIKQEPMLSPFARSAYKNHLLKAVANANCVENSKQNTFSDVFSTKRS